MIIQGTRWLLVSVFAVIGTAFPSEPARKVAPAVAKGSTQPQPASVPMKPVAALGPAVPDRLDLDVSVVTGNRELPKVLYIVPWKKAELGDLPEQPFNSLLDEALTPIDRDEFRREVAYYSKLAERSAGADAGEGEKPPIAPTTSR